MGAQTDRLRCEVFQNLILSPINTGLLRYAVATVLTVYGIETMQGSNWNERTFTLQQYLPFTVLKRKIKRSIHCKNCGVATVLTVYGIETYKVLVLVYESYSLQQYLPFTVLKLKCFRCQSVN